MYISSGNKADFIVAKNAKFYAVLESVLVAKATEFFFSLWILY
jgi:hypothetical protein